MCSFLKFHTMITWRSKIYHGLHFPHSLPSLPQREERKGKKPNKFTSESGAATILITAAKRPLIQPTSLCCFINRGPSILGSISLMPPDNKVHGADGHTAGQTFDFSSPSHRSRRESCQHGSVPATSATPCLIKDLIWRGNLKFSRLLDACSPCVADHDASHYAECWASHAADKTFHLFSTVN